MVYYNSNFKFKCKEKIHYIIEEIGEAQIKKGEIIGVVRKRADSVPYYVILDENREHHIIRETKIFRSHLDAKKFLLWRKPSTSGL